MMKVDTGRGSRLMMMIRHMGGKENGSGVERVRVLQVCIGEGGEGFF